MTDRRTPDKSTTVRTNKKGGNGEPRRRARAGWSVRAPQAALRTLLRLAPPLAPTVGARLFLSPPPPSIAGRRVPGTRLAIDLDGQPLAVWSRSRPGDRGTVLLVHGWGGDAGDMLPLSDALDQRGCSTILFDAPAHGESGGRTASMISFARSIRSVLDVLRPVNAVIGHSLGGAATALALTDDSVRRSDAAILIASPIHPADWLSRLCRALGLGAADQLRLQRAVETRVGLSFDELDIEARARRLTVPTLVVHDRGDQVVHPAAGGALHRALPDAQALWTDGLGHRRILSDEGVIERVVDFLQEHSDALQEQHRPGGLRDPQMAAFTRALDQSLETLHVG